VASAHAETPQHAVRHPLVEAAAVMGMVDVEVGVEVAAGVEGVEGGAEGEVVVEVAFQPHLASVPPAQIAL